MDSTFETFTVLALGARGRLPALEGSEGRPFTLVGRTCVRGPRGVVWNEWTARFDDGSQAYLAEPLFGAELTLYEERPLLPAFGALELGHPVDSGFIVVERGTAVRVASWGEIEEAPTTYRYADLVSRSGVATIDFGPDPGRPPRSFLGRRVTLDDLGLTKIRERKDAARFITVEELSRPSGIDVWLESGDEGTIDGVRWRVTGIVARSMTDDAGSRSTWEEYTLFAPEIGLRWLVVASGHWSFVETIENPSRIVDAKDEQVTFDGVVYDAASAGVARVDWASGALPWEVTIGETAAVKELAHPPWTLTCEGTADDLVWSRGIYVTPDVVAKAFGKRHLPKPAPIT